MTDKVNLYGMMAATLMAFACPTAVCAAFDCAPTHCTQITSCAEARYKLLVCGHSARDADNDGMTEDFSCSGKKRCSEMISCAEAQFYLKSCNARSLDRDGDGVACNAQCGR